MNNTDKLFEKLNKEQKEAVLSTEGPNLIVAGLVPEKLGFLPQD